MKWHNFIREYFTHNRRERRGVLVLATVIIALFFLVQAMKMLQPTPKVDFSEFNKKIAAYDAANETQEKSLAQKKYSYIDEEVSTNDEHKLFNFNPNNLPVEKWVQLGLSKKQAEVIKNYEAKGGKFYDKEDVRKMYTISNSMYERLEPYIVIPENKKNYKSEFEKEEHESNQKEKKLNVVTLIDINSADTAQLKTLRGIGSVFSSRIVKYRNLLGGYCSKGQLMEVYGMKKETFEHIKDKIEIQQSNIARININKCTAADLKKHPYINWNIANSVVAIRDKHGLYNKVEDIQKSDLVDEKLYSKIAPYLSVE